MIDRNNSQEVSANIFLVTTNLNTWRQTYDPHEFETLANLPIGNLTGYQETLAILNALGWIVEDDFRTNRSRDEVRKNGN